MTAEAATGTPKVYATPLKVFVSYAHEDDRHRATLTRHLSALKAEGLIEIWHDRRITGGREWAGAIDDALRSADIVLLLISADFLASDYCNDVELNEAIRLHGARLARVVPVILRSCDWKKSRFARFNALPTDGEPVVEAAYPDQRFNAVAAGLREVAAELLPAPAAGKPAMGPALWPLAPGKSKLLKIGKISLFGIELGPLEVPVPQVDGRLLLLAGVLALGLAGFGAYWLLLQVPLANAGEHLRKARYDLSLDALGTAPTWLQQWPAVAAARETAALGARTYAPRQDWEAIGTELRRLRKARPNDPGLMVIEAESSLRRKDYEPARTLVEAATLADPNYAQAWFLLGTIQDQSAGDLAGALKSYSRAVDLAGDSPQYRGNKARTLLDLGRHDEAIAEYRQIRQYPLARVELALAHWAKGDLQLAGEAQREALALLEDSGLMARNYNRLSWEFLLPNTGIRLTNLDDKKCYAQLGAAASLRLAGESAPFPPPTCPQPVHEIRALVADDLCRFVDRPQPGLVALASELRRALRMAADCGATATPRSG